MSRQIRVVIADDDAAVRSALADVLDADPRFLVVGTAASGDELELLAARTGPEMVLVDVRMPGGGAEAARALRAQAPLQGRSGAPAVVAVSAHTGAATVLAMLQAGAVGYLAKGRLADLPDLLARCAAGEVVLAVPSAADALDRLVRVSTGAFGAA